MNVQVQAITVTAFVACVCFRWFTSILLFVHVLLNKSDCQSVRKWQLVLLPHRVYPCLRRKRFSSCIMRTQWSRVTTLWTNGFCPSHSPSSSSSKLRWMVRHTHTHTHIHCGSLFKPHLTEAVLHKLKMFVWLGAFCFLGSLFFILSIFYIVFICCAQTFLLKWFWSHWDFLIK